MGNEDVIGSIVAEGMTRKELAKAAVCARCGHSVRAHDIDYAPCTDTTKRGLPCRCPRFIPTEEGKRLARKAVERGYR